MPNKKEKGAAAIAFHTLVQHPTWLRRKCGPAGDEVYFGQMHMDGHTIKVVYISGSSSASEWVNNISGAFSSSAFGDVVESIKSTCINLGYTGANVIMVGYSRGATLASLVCDREDANFNIAGLISLGSPGTAGADARQEVFVCDFSGNRDFIDKLPFYGYEESVSHYNETLKKGKAYNSTKWYWQGWSLRSRTVVKYENVGHLDYETGLMHIMDSQYISNYMWAARRWA